MTNNNIIFEQLLTEIIIKHPLNSEGKPMSATDISLAIGRNSGFIAQLRSRIKNGEMVSPKVLKLLGLHFAIDPSKLKVKKTDEIAALNIKVLVLAKELADLQEIITKKPADDFYEEIVKKMSAELIEQPGGA